MYLNEAIQRGSARNENRSPLGAQHLVAVLYSGEITTGPRGFISSYIRYVLLSVYLLGQTLPSSLTFQAKNLFIAGRPSLCLRTCTSERLPRWV